MNTATRILQNLTEYYAKSVVPTVNQMVGTFNRHKSAHEIAKTTVRPTGSLDLKRIQFYKTSEDIFQRKSQKPIGKSHGFIFLLDNSGSMSDVIPSVVRQTLIYFAFCKRIGVPFRVITFTNSCATLHNCYSRDGLIDNSDLKMVELLDQTTDIKDALKILAIYYYSSDITHRNVTSFFKGEDVREKFRRAGTPLVRSLITIGELAKQMKSYCQIVNVIAITDGLNNELFGRKEDKFNEMSFNTIDNANYINSPFTNKRYFLDDIKEYDGNAKSTAIAGLMLSEIGIRVINLHIIECSLQADISTKARNCMAHVYKNYNLIPETKAISNNCVKVDGNLNFQSTYYVSSEVFGQTARDDVFGDYVYTGKLTKRAAKNIAESAEAKNQLSVLNDLIVKEVCTQFA